MIAETIWLLVLFAKRKDATMEFNTKKPKREKENKKLSKSKSLLKWKRKMK